MRLAGVPSPSWIEWRGATILAALVFLTDYACVFWAEQRVPSGVTAVIMASIPVCITLLEIIFLRTQRLTLRLSLGLLVGVVGVVVLTDPTSSLGEAPLDRWGAVALLVGCCGWSIGTVVSRRMVLPDSKPMSAAAQMLSGGVQLLVLAAVSGEFAHFRPHDISGIAWFRWFSIIAGSIIAYTAYVWLLHHESPTKVGTYAHVNPVVAVMVTGLGGEIIGRRTRGWLILVSVRHTTMRRQTTPLDVSGPPSTATRTVPRLRWKRSASASQTEDAPGAQHRPRCARYRANPPAAETISNMAGVSAFCGRRSRDQDEQIAHCSDQRQEH
jgi:drug/metabolite transporter (DMT)-like permease